MIIKGRAVGSVRHWAEYLPDEEKNEKAIQHEIRGANARALKGALEEMREHSLNTMSRGNFMYHASFNPRADETLTLEQWMKAIDFRFRWYTRIRLINRNPPFLGNNAGFFVVFRHFTISILTQICNTLF